MKSRLKHLRLVAWVVGIGLALLAGTVHAQHASRAADSGFSFDVYGDSRSMMYLPYKVDQEAEARKLVVDMFELVLPPKVADAMVQKDVKLTYDPATKELVQMVTPFMTGEDPKEDYNYLRVDVTPGQPKKFTLNRFRPWSAEPFATVELYK